MTEMNNQEVKDFACDIAKQLPAGPEMAWWNYITEEYDHLPAGIPFHFTIKGARQYIPQTVASLGIFDCYLELGKTPFEAMFEALKAHVSKEDES